MPDFRAVLFYSGYLLLILGCAMIAPLALDLVLDQGQHQTFIGAMATTLFMGAALVLSTKSSDLRRLGVREAFLLMVLGLIFSSFAGSLPFLWSGLGLSFTDSVFESISGLTTTGATIIPRLDLTPASLLLWRALLNWMGGLAIIAAAVVILPRLRIGGMHMFRLENADKSRQVKLRYARVVGGVLSVYTLFSILLAFGYWFSGMTILESVCHAMSTLSTGGFSTSDNSFRDFSPMAQLVCVFGMIAGATTFTLFLAPGRKGRWDIFNNGQLRWFLAAIVGAGFLLTLWNCFGRGMSLADALEPSFFNVASVLSTTGYLAADYGDWGGFAQILFFFLAFVGGCTGSAAGGIKIFRFQVVFAMSSIHRKRLLHPNGVFFASVNGRPLTEDVERSVLGFMLLYFLGFALLALGLGITGLDVAQGMAAAAAALGNIGPGLDPLVRPDGDYHLMPEAAKWLLGAGMILGRLELAAVIVLFSRNFWRD